MKIMMGRRQFRANPRASSGGVVRGMSRQQAKKKSHQVPDLSAMDGLASKEQIHHSMWG